MRLKRPWGDNLNRQRIQRPGPPFLSRFGWPLLVGLVLVGAMLALRLAGWPKPRAETLEPVESARLNTVDSDRLQAALREQLEALGAAVEVREDATETAPALWHVYGQPGEAVLALHLALRRMLTPLGAQVLTSVSEPTSGQVALILGCHKTPALRMRLIAREAERPVLGRIALLIDDFGGRWDALPQAFARLGVPLSISVIPSTRHAQTVAREMAARGCEVVLHLPMEPFSTAFRDEPIMVKTGDGEAQIRRTLDQALKAVPGARGVNNHMGSKATSHRETMERLLDALKTRNLYFVDSRTIASTVGLEVARAKRVLATERQVFIDPEDDPAVIQRQIADLARQAARRGQALGIGHCRQNTLDALRREIPRLQAEGYRFVFVSELVK